MVVQTILDNYPMLLEMVGLLLLLNISTYIPERMRKMTRCALLLLLLESICFNLEQWTQSFDTLSLARPLLTACVYSLYPMILFFLMRIILEEQPSRRTILLFMLPELISVPLYFSSQWTHLVCWFSEDNHYFGGPLSYLPYVVVVYEAILILCKNYNFFKVFNDKDRRTAAFTIVAPLVGMVLLQVFQGGGDYSAMLTASILLYYAFIYIHMAKIDQLTSLFNRKCCYEDLAVRAKSIKAVASVDMNDLKYFNDNMGHQAGDEALKTVASVLREHCGPHGTVYRVGGDEFIILYSCAEEAWIRGATSDMRRKLSETPYTCAFGYAMVGPGQSVDEAMVTADQAMYADKAAIKMKQKMLRKSARDGM